METSDKKSIVKKWWFWLLAVIVFGLIIKALGGNSKLPAASTTAEQNDSAKTAAMLRGIAPPGCTASYFHSSHEVDLEYFQSNAIEYPVFLHDHFKRGIDFASKAFSNDSTIRKIAFVSNLAYHRPNGDEDTGVALQGIFYRAPFMDVKWESLEGKPISKALLNSLDTSGTMDDDGSGWEIQPLNNVPADLRQTVFDRLTY